MNEMVFVSWIVGCEQSAVAGMYMPRGTEESRDACGIAPLGSARDNLVARDVMTGSNAARSAGGR